MSGAPVHSDQKQFTFCDDTTGERVALSAGELAGWAARVAGLLHEGCGLDASSRVGVLAPAHWQTAAIMLGAWSAGIPVSYHRWSTAGLEKAECDAVFVTRTRLDSWLEEVPPARHRFVLLGEAPAGYRDFLAEAQRFPDSLPAYATIGAADAAHPDGTTFRQFGAVARELADRLDLRAGDRVLVDAAEVEEPLRWLLAPLSVGASVVVVAGLDRSTVDVRAAAEGANRIL
ncbi:TIGR03089 family protein [Virgisporangium aliadipatigenens]|uniref:TIGR03089 family protein n=1 Tax=Virgisporangium aliadipatigenens TaxID=741659 RepID=UPI0019430A53|nr:TIGR03089 family protein [Virgisporangium aliadipatigenens]